MRVKEILLFVMIVSLFISCGYKPSAKYARNVLGKSVSTTVVISKEDPENSVLVKDAVDTALIDTFHASLTTRKKSQTHLNITISNPTYTPIQYDANGFVIAYRMKINLNITLYHDGKAQKYSASGYYDFAVTPNAIITDQQRFDAIRYAASKAIEAFIAKLSSTGAKDSYAN